MLSENGRESILTSVNLSYSYFLQPSRRPGMTCCHAEEDTEASKNSEESMNQTNLCSLLSWNPREAESELIWLLLRICKGPALACCSILNLLRQGPSFALPGFFHVILTGGNICWLVLASSLCGDWVRWPEGFYGFLWDRVQVDEWNEI